jgi:hypothetical protein
VTVDNPALRAKMVPPPAQLAAESLNDVIRRSTRAQQRGASLLAKRQHRRIERNQSIWAKVMTFVNPMSDK